jgi:hypothetical protein
MAKTKSKFGEEAMIFLPLNYRPTMPDTLKTIKGTGIWQANSCPGQKYV